MNDFYKAMKRLQESKRISLKEANETATFELDWANEDIANMENDQEKELTLIKNVENTLKTNKIGAKVEIVSIDGNDFGGWPVVKVTGPKEELAKNIGLYYLENSEDDIDYNEIYDTYLEGKELKEAEPTKLGDIVKVDPNKKEITYPKQDKNDPRKPSDITKDELLNSDKDEEIELPSTEDGTAKKEIQDMLDRSWNRKHNIGIENEDYWKDKEAGKCYKCGKVIPDGEKYIIDGQQYCLDCKGDAEQELLDQSEPERNIDNFNDYYESKDNDRYQLRKFPNEEDFKGTYGCYDTKENKFISKGSKSIMQGFVNDKNKNKVIKESTEFYTDEALKVLDYIQNEMTNEQRKKLFIDECGDFEFDNEVDQLKEFWDWLELLDSDDIEELGNKLNIVEEPEYQSDKELEMRKFNESSNEITLDEIANKASELGYDILDDDRDEEGKTILVYSKESTEEDNFDDFDNKELYAYLDSIPNVRYQIDNNDSSCLAIWLKEINESKLFKEADENSEEVDEETKRNAYRERTKKRIKEYQDSIDMEPLFNWLREVTNIPELKFKVEKEESRGEYYINFESQNVVENTGIMKLALDDVRVDSFANGVTTMAPSYYSDKKIDYDTDYELYYWVQCHFSFKLKEGGSNGVKFGSATCREGKWNFKLTETR